jgi:hypothetical protein
LFFLTKENILYVVEKDSKEVDFYSQYEKKQSLPKKRGKFILGEPQ